MDPTDSASQGAGESTPDDWTPWSTPESATDDAPAESAADAPEATSATPVASQRAKRLAQQSDTTPARASRRRAAAPAAGAAPAASASWSVGGIVAAVGGIVVIVGSLLEMVKVGLGVSNLTRTTLSTNYFDTDNGKIVAALGAIALVLALTTLVRPVANIIPAIVVAACGLAAFGLALSDRIDLDSAGDEFRREFLRGNRLSDLVQVGIGPSVYVVMAGGLIVAIGAVLASRDR